LIRRKSVPLLLMMLTPLLIGILTSAFDLVVARVNGYASIEGLTTTLYDPFNVWNYTGAWEYLDPYGSGAEGHVDVSNGMLHVSGYGPPYGDCGLTTIKEFNYTIIVEARLRSNSDSNSPKVIFGLFGQPGFIHIYYDSSGGGWHAGYYETTGMSDAIWGGSLSAGTWYKLKLVVNKTNFKVYLNDVLEVDRDWSSPQEHQKTVSFSSSYGSFGSGDFDWIKIFSPSVGGYAIPIDKLGLLAPYIALAVVLVSITTLSAYAWKHRTKKTTIQRTKTAQTL